MRKPLRNMHRTRSSWGQILPMKEQGPTAFKNPGISHANDPDLDDPRPCIVPLW